MAKGNVRVGWNQTSVLPYEPDILASHYYSKNYQTKWMEPEKDLMLAILMEAVETYKRFAFSTSPSEQKLFREAEAWFWNEEVDGIFSFRSICGVIGLDAVYLRRGLRQWTMNPAQKKSCRRRIPRHSARIRVRKTTISV